MSWRSRIALCVVFAAAGAALWPMTKAPAGDLCPGEQYRCGVPGTVTPVACKKSIPSLLVNNRRLRLNYNLSEVGPSGVSAVELWATRDGKNWQRYSNEPPPAGPLCVHVAEEGKYGFSLVVKNGLGASSPAPKSGDEPQLWVEVDETAPGVQLTSCHVCNGESLMIGWAANDSNLATRPVTISTGVSKEGPWTVIAGGLENTGRYVWQLPKDLPYEFYVKVEAADRAGNVGSDHTLRPVKVDLARPKGTILGVEGNGQLEVKTEPVEEPPAHVFEYVPAPGR